MGSTKKINVDRLAMTVLTRLEDWKDVTIESMKIAVNNTAVMTADEINENAAKLFQGKKYSKSWSSKRDPNLKGRYRYDMVVYSKKPYYRLAHLLENGHAKVSGGRTIGDVKGREHIATPASLVEKRLTEALKSAIEYSKNPWHF